LQTYGAHKNLEIYADAGGGGEVMLLAEDELRAVMRARRHLAPNDPDAFEVDSSATFQNMLGNILNNFGAVVVAIAAISLVIGGIVIMNIMLVSVTERTREIGVRKALGAKRRDVLLQFLIEAATLALIGGVIGVICGIGAAKVITLVIGFPSVVSLWSVFASLALASGVGLFFGIYPAHKASQLDPIDALRAEL
jgi:putative ABC transport system permease protein